MAKGRVSASQEALCGFSVGNVQIRVQHMRAALENRLVSAGVHSKSGHVS